MVQKKQIYRLRLFFEPFNLILDKFKYCKIQEVVNLTYLWYNLEAKRGILYVF